MCKERKDAWWNKKCKEIEVLERKHKTKDMHVNVKEMSTKERSKSGTNCIHDKNWKMLTDGLNMSLNYNHDEGGDRPGVSNQNGYTIIRSQKLKM